MPGKTKYAIGMKVYFTERNEYGPSALLFWHLDVALVIHRASDCILVDKWV